MRSRPSIRRDRLVETLAWGDGGYYGRLFMNVRGREPNGSIPPGLRAVRQGLIEEIAAITDPHGAPARSPAPARRALPHRERRGPRPDRLLRQSRLALGGSVGMGSIYTFDNDTGPDDANHAQHGIFIMNEVGCQQGRVAPGYKEGLRLYDVGATLLDLFGLPPDPQAVGRSMAAYQPGFGTRIKQWWKLST